MAWVCLIKMHESYGLMAVLGDDKVWGVRGFASKADALGYFERGYDAAHRRSYESSMSACLNWLHFQASVVDLKDSEMPALVSERAIKTGRHISGRMDFIPLIAEKAEPIWKAGAKPELIGR